MKVSRAALAMAFLVVACAPGERDFGDSQTADGGGHDAPTVSPRGDAGDTPSVGGDASVTESDDETTQRDMTERATESAADASVGSTGDAPTTGVETATGRTSEGEGTGWASGTSAASTNTSVVDTTVVGTSGEPSYPTGETHDYGSDSHSEATSAEPSSVSSSSVTSSAPWGTEDTASAPTTGNTSAEDTHAEPECQTATDCGSAPNYCHGVECIEGKCDYPHIREGELCGGSSECSQDRCYDGECLPDAVNDGTYCGGSNLFCSSIGSCQRGGCELSSACNYAVSGSYAQDDGYGYSSGIPAYFLGTSYEEMHVGGSLLEAATLTFHIHLPVYNPNSTCGGASYGKTAVLWVGLNGSQIGTVSNWQLANETWTTFGPVSLGAGVFDLKLYAGEGDGCGWPDYTMPIYVSGFEFRPINP